MSSAPPLGRVLETALYVDDLARARAFYEDVLGLGVLVAGARFVALDAGGVTVLLLFLRGASAEGDVREGRGIPGHDAHGSIHFALAVEAERIDEWRRHLRARRVTIEGEHAWPRGGLSLYFRDPDGHLVELATPGIWETY